MAILHIHMVARPEPERLAQLQRALDSMGVDGPLSWSFGDEVSGDVEVLVAGRPTASQLDAGAVRALIIPFAGMPQKTLALVRARPSLAVYNLHHNAAAVAEMALGLLLAAARCVVPMDRALRLGDWRGRYGEDPGVLLAGGRVVILGFGAIGRRVAHLCEGLGMGVDVVRRHPDAGQHTAAALPRLLTAARALIVAVPHTEETEGLIDAQALSCLGARGVLVNIARARVVDQEALYEALRDGRLHSAGLDVWTRYPRSEAERAHTMPSSWPFHELDNVVLSPHRSGHGESVEVARMAHMAQVIGALALDVEVPNRVDVARGY